MLGETIADPQCVEGGGQESGLHFLPMDTELEIAKRTIQVAAQALFLKDQSVKGYEIHMGITRRRQGEGCFLINDHGSERVDGAQSSDGLIWGTYLHGVFDAPEFRRAWLNRVRLRKGLSEIGLAESEQVSERLLAALDRWADHVECHVDMKKILRAIGHT